MGYTALRDFRQNAGGLDVPDIATTDILGPNGQNMTSFGPDPFTKNNLLDQDVIQFNDNFTIYLKDHTVSLGTANEYYSFNNVFTQVVNGNYRYNSLADFCSMSGEFLVRRQQRTAAAGSRASVDGARVAGR